MTTWCQIKDCQLQITLDIIQHFVWFDNPQSHSDNVEDFNTTRDCCFVNTISVDQIVFPLEWIWFENGEKLYFDEEDIPGLVLDYSVPNFREDDQDLLYLDQMEKNSNLEQFVSASPG